MGAAESSKKGCLKQFYFQLWAKCGRDWGQATAVALTLLFGIQSMPQVRCAALFAHMRLASRFRRG
eukprot:5459678-Alexandrium_andersonii.AAC.1